MRWVSTTIALIIFWTSALAGDVGQATSSIQFKDIISLVSGGTVAGNLTELTDDGPMVSIADGRVKIVPWNDVAGIGLFREVARTDEVGAFNVFGATRLRRGFKLLRGTGPSIQLFSPAAVFVPRGTSLMQVDWMQIPVTASFEHRIDRRVSWVTVP